ncbi:MAG: EamA family transporter, partial [Anaerolineae bacterium]
MTSKPLPYILLLGSLFGSSLVVSRFSLGEFDARAFVSLRLILASLAHLLLYLLSRSRSLPRDPSLWFRASVLGVFGTAAV